eukprot:gb/GFBE01075003.1/.p1 GENE.gb/GFBE01075003.1/~~gb/GFBE01075003.1/.p1  ORF type:complete len:299 (+),score=61.78 gb/GFBE01075003.1/:1-897(+)
MCGGIPAAAQTAPVEPRLFLGRRRSYMAERLFVGALGPCTPSKPSEGYFEARWADSHKPQRFSSTTSLADAISRAIEAAMEDSVTTRDPRQQRPDIFDSSTVPGISVEKYLKRLQAIFRCSDAALVGALILLDRFLATCETAGKAPQAVTALNVHRLFFACLIVTVKYNEDLHYGNSHYAKAGGIQLREVNRMERHLLRELDFDLRIEPAEFDSYESALHRFGIMPEVPFPLQAPVVPFQKMGMDYAATSDPQQSTAEAAANALLSCGAVAEVPEAQRSKCRPDIHAMTTGPSLILQQ